MAGQNFKNEFSIPCEGSSKYNIITFELKFTSTIPGLDDKVHKSKVHKQLIVFCILLFQIKSCQRDDDVLMSNISPI